MTVRWRWLAFGTVITAAVMDLLDSTIAQVAAPTIRRELGGSYAVIEWVTAAAVATVGLLACSFVVAFGLPRRAREMGGPEATREAAQLTADRT